MIDRPRKAAHPKCAVDAVPLSGLELVPRRKHRGKIATARDCSKMDFEPWHRTPDMQPDELVPSNEVLREFGVYARMAYAIMLRTKPELMEMPNTLDEDKVENMMANLLSTAEEMKQIVSMIESAYMRMLVALSVVALDRPRAKRSRPAA
jgi:hypothetical protein